MGNSAIPKTAVKSSHDPISDSVGQERVRDLPSGSGALDAQYGV